METIIVEILLAGVNECFDFSMPSQIPVGSLLGELVKVVASCTPNAVVDDRCPVLMERRTGAILDREKTLAENGVCDGMKLTFL